MEYTGCWLRTSHPSRPSAVFGGQYGEELTVSKAKPAPTVHPANELAFRELIAQITVDAYGDDEQLWAFRQAFEDGVAVPRDAFVIGEPVSVVKFDYAGNGRRGLTAKCRRPNGREYVVAASDVVFPQGTEGARYVAAYRIWMGLTPFPPETAALLAGKTPHETTGSVIHAKDTVELAVLSVKSQTARCRFLGKDRIVTLRSRRGWVPGEIVQVKLRKAWTSSDAHVSAEIKSDRIDVQALGLTPLRLENRGVWNPIHEYWGEEGEPIEGWAKRIIAWGPRQAFEMEQVLPGHDFADPEFDPIGVSNDRKDSGDTEGAYKVLMELCEADLRCLDAHAHLGNLAFNQWPWYPARHYEVGFRIGELSLVEGFDGVLPWGHIDNRPFLRCMHGYGLCLWRLGKFPEALQILDRLLWLNPSDNQGVRFLIDDVRANRAWEDRQYK
ncbi:MAG TPA: hypothetical protein VGZ73_13080 [Bryobacteraceae bacterium]|jgi:hypothetical protein|nr:hypothetical protein [Bryobacteraceae bacterium]